MHFSTLKDGAGLQHDMQKIHRPSLLLSKSDVWRYRSKTHGETLFNTVFARLVQVYQLSQYKYYRIISKI